MIQMIDRNQFVNLVNDYFSFLENEYKFNKIKETINDNLFYDIEYKGSEKIISISYENIENYLNVVFFMLRFNELPNYDDKSKTLHLNKLNKFTFSKVNAFEINENNSHFSNFVTKNIFEKELLKNAKELRLTLKYNSSLKYD